MCLTQASLDFAGRIDLDEIKIVQSALAKELIAGMQDQNFGRGRYGFSDHSKYIEAYNQELAAFSGKPLGVAIESTDYLISLYDHLKVTGKENPVLFAKSCRDALSGLNRLRQLGLNVPETVSIGLIERHEANFHAVQSTTPPLLVFTSGMFDLLGDVAFLTSFSFVRISMFGHAAGAYNEHETKLLKDMILYHSYSSTAVVDASNGGALFIQSRHRDAPILQNSSYGETFAAGAAELKFQIREALYEFFVLHECTHLCSGGEFEEDADKGTVERRSDAVAMMITSYDRVHFSKQHEEPPLWTLAKVLAPLFGLRFLELVDAAKLSISEKIPFADARKSPHEGDYPSFQERLKITLNLGEGTLKEGYGIEAAHALRRVWQDFDRFFEEALLSIEPSLDEQFCKDDGFDVNRIVQKIKADQAKHGKGGEIMMTDLPDDE